VGFETEDGLTVLLRSGDKIKADMAVVALGVVPDTGLAKDAGLELGVKGTIVVDEHMQTSDPDIYAVGDAIQVENLITGAPGNIALAGPANKQGRIVADNIAGLDSVYKGSMGSSVLRVFDMTVGATGLTEKQAKDAGYDVEKVYTFSASHASYYPGAKNMSIKTIFDQVTGTVLGAQIVGYDGVDKRVDVMAVAIRAGMTVEDLSELELSYAPPYSSAKDPVNYAGFVATNLISGLVKQYHWDELDSKVADPNITVVDLRTAAEYANQHIEGPLHIPVDELRDRLSEIPKDKPVAIFCHSGLRSYIGYRILAQNGYDCSHMAGGFRFYASVVKDLAIGSPEDYPCGIKSS
jgi:rhodanese-related sulfurtransferase